MSLLKIGYVRTSNDYDPFSKAAYDLDELPHIASCACDPFQLSTLFLLCPLTSIIFGLGRIVNVLFRGNLKQEALKDVCYFLGTGIIAMIGLGFIISIIRILNYSVFLLLKGISYCVSNLNTCLVEFYGDEDNICLKVFYFKVVAWAEWFSYPTICE